MSGKSALVHRTAELYPDARYRDVPPPTGANYATLVVIDAMQAVRGLNHSGKTWRELSQRLLVEVRQHKRLYPAARCMVLAFDNYNFVPVAKAVEQGVRAERADVGEPAGALDDFECGPLDAAVPDAFMRAVHDRDRHLREIIRFFVRHWMTLDLPPGLTLIVAGHYLRPGDLPASGSASGGSVSAGDDGVGDDDGSVSVGDDDGELDQEELSGTPLRFANGCVELATDLANRLGEGDYTMPFMLRALGKGHDAAAVLSIDSDLLFILLLLKMESGTEVFWRRWPRLSFLPNSNGYGRLAGKNAAEWWDVGALRQRIADDARLGALKDPVATFCAAAAAAGGDYTDPIPRVTPVRYLETLLAPGNAGYIGDVATRDGDIEVEAFKRLVWCACGQAKAGNKKLFRADPDKDMVNTLVPRPADLLYRRKHLAWFWNMTCQAGAAVLSLPDPRQYGYGRRDRSRPLGRNNIVRLHNEDAPDE